MYVISNVSERGNKQYFTGRTKLIRGERIAIMAMNGDMKKYTSVKSVCKAVKNLERKCHEQKPFIAELYSKYLKEKWSPIRL
jgi:hypothetical protein